jgi:exodeoxyribonuclease V gamma subunit
VLQLHRAERADGLVGALRDLLAEPLGDPFAPELVAVPTRGMERWLTQRLSAGLGASAGRGDGVCANVGFPSPRRLVAEAVAAASGIAADADPWQPERAVWPLLEVVDEALGEPWLAPLATHVEGERRARRFAVVRHLADLFDRYALQRPDLVRAWAAGEDDGTWQAELWRRLRARIAVPDPAERLGAACDRLRASPDLVDLPPRVSLFGLTRLPAGHLAVLRALAAGRDVHLFLLHPSPVLWEEVAAHGPVRRRREDPTADLPRNRLLASWGQDARELQLVVGEHDADHHHPVEHPAGTLLARIQEAVREDRAPEPAPADPRDDSIQVHACHGRARQVEVVRDAVLHLLEADPTLEPRDVVVMCPDIETFAPLIQATFGAGEVPADDEDDDPLPAGVRPPDLRVRLADRALRQTNPVLGVVAELLELADQRLTASQVLGLADAEPVRRRFGLDDDDVTRFEDWVAAGGIRWGLDAAHRAPFKLDKLGAGTWRAGLDRVLAGVAMTEDDCRLFAGVLPLDDVESGAIDLVGRFAELVDRLHAAVDLLRDPKPVAGWGAAVAEVADALTATAPREAWQRAELQRVLDDVVGEADGAATPLTLAEVRALLGERLQGRPTRANFRTGHLTICTLMPMRSVPHRVVCLLGLDDGAFPRRGPRDGDDLLLADPHVGDRDARLEDRQLLLDALLAATDRLVITYTGNDERTNAERPPAVPVGELLDAVERTAPGAAVVVRHPLQPFDPRNFQPDRPWGFDPVTLEGARALAGERDEPGPFLPAPLPPLERPLLEVEDLVRFVQHPVRAFLRQRLGIFLTSDEHEVEDALPVELDGLGEWGVGDRLLASCLDGAPLEAAEAAEVARGALPPGALAGPVLQRVRPVVAGVAAQARAVLGDAAGGAGSLDVRVDLGGGRVLSGTVAGVVGDVVRLVTYSRVSPKHRLAAYVRWLALTAAHPDRRFEAVTIGRAPKDSDATVTVARIQAGGGGALDQLRVLVDLYDRGMREPLPLACMAAAAYAQAVPGPQAHTAGKRAWESGWKFDKEDKDLEHQLVHGGVLGFDDLLAFEPRDDECGPGWDEAEPTRFGRYARRLWAGLLAVEEVGQR